MLKVISSNYFLFEFNSLNITSTTRKQSLSEIATVTWLILGVALLVASLSPTISGDGEIRLHDVIRLFRHDDIPRAQFSVIQPFLSVPLYWLGTRILTPESITAWFNCIIFVIFVYCLYRQIPDLKIRFFSIALLLCSTMFPHHLNRYDGETLTAVTVTLGFLYLINHRPIVAAVLLTIGVAQTPATFPAFVLAMCFYVWRTRQTKLLWLVTLPLLLILGETYIKYGALLNNPYVDGNRGVKTIMPYSGLPGFSYPFFLGLISILFSFGKGLLFFIPALFMRFIIKNNKQDSKIVLLIDVLLLFVSGMVLTYAKWWSWYGGNSWGPRFFLIGCVPASLILAIWLSDRQQKMIGLVSGCFILILSSWVCIQGFVYAEKNLEICTQNNYTQEFLCWYTPEFSPIWRQFITTFETNINAIQILFVGWCTVTCFVFFAIKISQCIKIYKARPDY